MEQIPKNVQYNDMCYKVCVCVMKMTIIDDDDDADDDADEADEEVEADDVDEDPLAGTTSRGFIAGNNNTSLMLVMLVRNIVIRSIPIPQPAVGGNP